LYKAKVFALFKSASIAYTLFLWSLLLRLMPFSCFPLADGLLFFLCSAVIQMMNIAVQYKSVTNAFKTEKRCRYRRTTGSLFCIHIYLAARYLNL
jgi:hypothetical protein